MKKEEVETAWNVYQKIIVLFIIAGLMIFTTLIIIKHSTKNIKNKSISNQSISEIHELDTMCSIKLPNTVEGRIKMVDRLNQIYESDEEL